MYKLVVKFERIIRRIARFGVRNIDLEIVGVEDDTLPSIQFTCVDYDNVAINLTGKTVDFFLRQAGVTSGHINAVTACVVTNAVSGIVTYSFGSSDIPTPGTYFGDLQITDTGKKETAADAVRLIIRPANK